MKTVTVIMVNYNGKKFLRNCIESIKNQTYKNVSILIVDNCSKDKSVKFIKTKYPEIKLIICTENNGFSKGNNIGISYAIEHGSDYILLLNVDTIIDPYMIEHLVREANESTVTVPKIYFNKTKRIWYAGGVIDLDNGRSYHLIQNNNNKTREVSFACGCCMMIHKDIIKTVGMFDENYYLYFEDTDLSFRWKKNNIKIKYIPEARMWHIIGGSGGKYGQYIKSYYMTRNQLYFIHKYQNDIRIKPLKKAMELFVKNVLTESDAEQRKYICLGIWDFYKGNMSKLRR